MKNAAQIIDSIQSKPQFSRLSSHKCMQRVQSMFTPPVQKMINFVYIKNKTLFFVFNHPVGKQEFDNNIQTIKSALKFYMPPECLEEDEPLFTDIRAFVTYTPKNISKEQQKQKEVYQERSSGNFEIPIEDEKLHALALSIQKIIKEIHKNDA